jgi:uncharacterized membrane protein (DUF4010 family)
MLTNDLNIIYVLALSLALGLIIGVEREWRERDHEGGIRPAGVRTFGLIGLGGGIAGVLGGQFPALLPTGLALTIAIMAMAYWRGSHDKNFMGVTTIFAAFIAYGCGGLAVAGHHVAATAAAVTVAIILGAKERLHRFVSELDQKEIFAALQFLLIAGVILPLAPNQRFGPYDALNPFEIWLMVVLISGISFLGYISARVLSAQRGILSTAILGGFVSSTAVTLSFARMGQRQPHLQRILANGIVIAATIMMARVAVIAAIVWPPLLAPLGPVILVMIITATILCAIQMRRQNDSVTETPTLSNPLEILPALFFAGLLAVIMIVSRWLEATFGAQGVYAIAVVSGIADVDAITLSLSNFARDGLDVSVAAIGIFAAAITNTLFKIVLTTVAGGAAMTRFVSGALAITIAVGLGVAFITLF